MEKENQVREIQERDVSLINIYERMGDAVFNELPIFEEEAEVVADILNNLGGYSVEGALLMLDKAKAALLKCTFTHDKYLP